MIENNSKYILKGDNGASDPIAASQNNMVTVSDSGSTRQMEEFQAIQHSESENMFALRSVSQRTYLTCVNPGGYAETTSNDAVYFNIQPVDGETNIYTVEFSEGRVYLTEASDSPGTQITFKTKDTGRNSTKQKWKFVKSVTSK